MTTATDLSILMSMVLPDPHRSIVSKLDYFNQLRTSHIKRLFFPNHKSRSTMDNVMGKLIEGGYVVQVERPSPGGKRGGSGEIIWGLGRAGWRMCERPGRFRSDRKPDYHSLTIAGVYVKLIEDDRAGKYKLRGFSPEPVSHKIIDGIVLKPDLLVELQRLGGSTLSCNIEVDMGTQHPSRIIEKLDRYKRAYDHASDKDLPLPRVVFVAHDEERRVELEWIIKQFGNDDKYFWTATAEYFPDDLT